jgi:GDPmannose 4,6-dehydratase
MSSPAATRKALVCGITGQDGPYLARLLLGKGYTVVGTSRDASVANTSGLSRLGLMEKLRVVSMAPNDFRSVLTTIAQQQCDEIYYLAGQSSVGLSFEQPVEAIDSIAMGILNVLEAMRFTNAKVRLYHAGSSECFGNTDGRAANEDTPFHPRSPYAVAKSCAHNLVANYRDAYGLHASTGILFNHESPLRPERFVTQKVVKAAARIAAGSGERLSLGSLEIQRDWGLAEDYVDSMWRMLQQDRPGDYVVATGRTESLAYFVEAAFRHFGLQWKDHVDHDPSLLRPSEILRGVADPARAAAVLGWSASHDIDGVVSAMCEAAVRRD